MYRTCTVSYRASPRLLPTLPLPVPSHGGMPLRGGLGPLESFLESWLSGLTSLQHRRLEDKVEENTPLQASRRLCPL